jgi:predicted Zn-dependent protease
MATASAETALAVTPSAASTLLNLIPATARTPETAVLEARAKLAEGRAAEAASELAAIQEQKANQYISQYRLARAQYAQGQFAWADAALSAYLALYPEDSSALEARVDVASRRQDWQSALTAQTKRTSLNPDSAADQCRLGDLFLRSRQIQAAEGPLQRGLQLDPYAFVCPGDLGELYRALGRTGEAIRELEWVMRYFPEADAKTYVSLALAYQAAADRGKANRALEKGRRIFPQDKLLSEFALR